MEYITLGLLAHVDAGKTTLSEGMLFASGKIRELGRVDKQNTFLDTFDMEKKRGITIFSKQALLNYEEKEFTLLDTPGHIDFSAEMERALQVLDYAILVISGADGIQAHTKTLWSLLKKNQIPVFIFMNKMDRNIHSKEELMEVLKQQLAKECVHFQSDNQVIFMEEIATCSEPLLDQYLSSEECDLETIKIEIKERKIIPVFFGSALKMEGVTEFLENIGQYTMAKPKEKEFSAKVFKIGKDEQGNKLTYIKIFSGSLQVKESLEGEKVNQIRLYTGEKYSTLNEAEQGQICTLVGPKGLSIGMKLGHWDDKEKDDMNLSTEAILTYEILLPPETDPVAIFPKLKTIEEEEPIYQFQYLEQSKQLQVGVMGQVQLEVLQAEVESRFQLKISFGQASVLYKETIEDRVEGVGHFEPLKHYAEVHLLMEPLAVNQGLIFTTNCSEDLLAKQWQRLVLTHLKEKIHRGVLTNSPITDMKITLVSGKAHLKHTEGGDFRQAVYRAIRQGLREASSRLLEPYVEYELYLPESYIGKAMVDMEQKGATLGEPEYVKEGLCLKGRMPFIQAQNYQQEVTSYTKGKGTFSIQLAGYFPCHNEENVIKEIGYDVESDVEHTADSIFCAHGAGFMVPWHEVKKHAHLPCIKEPNSGSEEIKPVMVKRKMDVTIGTEEVEAIIERTFFANKNVYTNKSVYTNKQQRIKEHTVDFGHREINKKEKKILMIDAYNMIFGCNELKNLGHTNMDSARKQLEDMAENYQALLGYQIVVVYDAYRVSQMVKETLEKNKSQKNKSKKNKIEIIYTKENQTADQYIERYVHENQHNCDITVATSDGLEQTIVRGQGGSIISVKECYEQMESRLREQLSTFRGKQENKMNHIQIDVEINEGENE